MDIKMQIALMLSMTAWIASAKVFFEEGFGGSSFEPLWKYPSKSSKAAELGKFQLSSGMFNADPKINQGLQTTEDNKYYAISAPLKEPFDNKDQPFVVQFSVKHEQIIDCGGGYIKLLGKSADPEKFGAETPYEIMFGPDICGNMRKLMLLFTKNGKDHLWKKKVLVPSDDLTHMYTLVLHPDNNYEVYVDGEQRAKGNLIDDWDIVAPRKISDPDAKKPDDWVEERDMQDPEDKKPENWIEGLEPKIPDLEAKKPADWDEESDGKWEPPMIDNPDYRPKWKPRRVPNPAYKGPWKAPMIDNPDFKDDPNLYKFSEPVSYIAIEIWQVKSGSIFDNFLITNDPKEAEKKAVELFENLKESETKARDEHHKKLKEEKTKLEISQEVEPVEKSPGNKDLEAQIQSSKGDQAKVDLEEEQPEVPQKEAKAEKDKGQKNIKKGEEDSKKPPKKNVKEDKQQKADL